MSPLPLLAALLLLPALLVAQPQTLTHPEQLDLLTQANRAFEQALSSRDPRQAEGYYRQAIKGYERLIDAGVRNAKLHYNLGNAYLRVDDLGRAIAHYRRGLRLEPGNRRLQANLHHARSLRVDKVAAGNRSAVLPSLLFWHDDLRLSTQTTLAILAFLMVWAGAFVRLFRRRARVVWLIAGAALLCLLFTASALLVHHRNTPGRYGVVVAREATVRKGNGDSYALQLAQPLHPGTEFTVLETRGAWLHTQLENGIQGWIRRGHAVVW